VTRPLLRRLSRDDWGERAGGRRPRACLAVGGGFVHVRGASRQTSATRISRAQDRVPARLRPARGPRSRPPGGAHARRASPLFAVAEPPP